MLRTSTDLPKGGVRFRSKSLHGLVFRRYPIEVAPPDGLTGFVNNDTWQIPATYEAGEWRTLKGKPISHAPTHWTAIEKPEHD